MICLRIKNTIYTSASACNVLNSPNFFFIISFYAFSKKSKPIYNNVGLSIVFPYHHPFEKFAGLMFMIIIINAMSIFTISL